MAKIIFVILFPSVFTIQLVLTFCSSVYSEDSSPVPITTSVWDRLDAWYSTYVLPKEVTGQGKQYAEIVGAIKNQHEKIVDDIEKEKADIAEKLEAAEKAAYSYGCCLNLRKEFETVYNYYFPNWLKACSWDKRMKWLAFFTMKPENDAQFSFQNRMRKQEGLTPSAIARTICLISEASNEKAHPREMTKFLESQDIRELIPACGKVFNLRFHIKNSEMVVDMFLGDHDAEERMTDFKPDCWGTAALIELSSGPGSSDSEIKNCLTSIFSEKNDKIEVTVQRLWAGGDKSNEKIVAELFLRDTETSPEAVEVEIKSSIKCINLGWVQNNNPKLKITIRTIEGAQRTIVKNTDGNN